jgi:hypothetical protein
MAASAGQTHRVVRQHYVDQGLNSGKICVATRECRRIDRKERMTDSWVAPGLEVGIALESKRSPS